MKKNIFTIMMIFTVLFSSNAKASAIGIAKISITVIDENGNPLADTKVRVRFSGGGKPVFNNTDDNGSSSISESSNDGVVVGTAIRDGYYESTFHQDFYVKKLGFWQPFGKELKVVMRPIVNPVPMYVRNRYFEFPKHDEKIGFDLEKADWVIPYGQGIKPDFVYEVKRRYINNDNFDATLTITFSNQFDGIQVYKDDAGDIFNVGSWFRLPRTAPLDGYMQKMQRHISKGSFGRVNDGASDDNNFIFRVRSEVDQNGKLIRAMYGKIRGDIKFAPIGSMASNEGVGAIGLHYYLNPDYTTNLEFDPKKNIFISLPRNENVKQP